MIEHIRRWGLLPTTVAYTLTCWHTNTDTHTNTHTHTQIHTHFQGQSEGDPVIVELGPSRTHTIYALMDAPTYTHIPTGCGTAKLSYHLSRVLEVALE